MLIAINGIFFNKPYTGIGQYTRNLVNSLTLLNDKFNLIVFVNSTDNQYLDIKMNNNINIDFVPIKKIPIKNDIIQHVLFEEKVLNKAFKIGVDVLHTPYLYTPLVRKSKIKHVVTIHDVIPKIFTQYRNGYIRNRYFSFLEKRLKNVDQIITVSNNSRDDIIKYLNIETSKVSVIYESVNPVFLNTPDSSACQIVKEKYKLPDDFIFYVGGFDYRKNVSSLIQAYSYLKKNDKIDKKLIIAGEFSPTQKQLKLNLVEDIPQIIKELNLENEVKMVGYIPQKEIPIFYKLSEICVYPSLYEGFGLPILEAMYCSTPILTSKVSSIPELINRDDLLFNPKDVKEISEKMLWLLSDKSLRKSISEWIINRAKKFTWEEASQKTYSTYIK